MKYTVVLFSSLAMVSWRASGSAGVDSRTGSFDLQKKVLSTLNANFSRTVYPDFVHRFIIIKPKEVHECGADLKAGTKVILDSIKEMEDKWR